MGLVKLMTLSKSNRVMGLCNSMHLVSCVKLSYTELFWCELSKTHIEGILPKGPYPPCLRMADRALLTGCPRHTVILYPWLCPCSGSLCSLFFLQHITFLLFMAVCCLVCVGLWMYIISHVPSFLSSMLYWFIITIVYGLSGVLVVTLPIMKLDKRDILFSQKLLCFNTDDIDARGNTSVIFPKYLFIWWCLSSAH